MKKRHSELFEWIKVIVVALTVAFLVRTFIFSPIILSRSSMLPTFEGRDKMIVKKFTYRFNEPDRFDIVVFHATMKNDFIKRLIGLLGEHVAVEDHQLYIDGEKTAEPFINGEDVEDDISSFLTSDFTLEDLEGNHETIPNGHVLVLGDNRNNSTDSRSLGVIPMDEIVGKASIIFFPFDRMEMIKE